MPTEDDRVRGLDKWDMQVSQSYVGPQNDWRDDGGEVGFMDDRDIGLQLLFFFMTSE